MKIYKKINIKNIRKKYIYKKSNEYDVMGINDKFR